MKTMFIIKRRTIAPDPSAGCYSARDISSGLVNSATFVSDMLVRHGIDSKVVQVVDNNCIDREVTAFRPDYVFIEAIWVVPEKFNILRRLHPHVTWVIRVHSEVPFMANEGQSMDWLFAYSRYERVVLSANSPRVNHEISCVVAPSVLLPNYYPIPNDIDYAPQEWNEDLVHIGCFGAIRPLKNHLLQAMAAIQFADDRGLQLHFHINVNRLEDNGDPVLKNLRGLFAGRPEHRLVQHPWANHNDFLKIIRCMNLGMQASLTETFNIVTADLVTHGIPVVVSPEVSWCSFDAQVDPTSFRSILNGLHWVWEARADEAQRRNTEGLALYDSWSEQLWLEYLS